MALPSWFHSHAFHQAMPDTESQLHVRAAAVRQDIVSTNRPIDLPTIGGMEDYINPFVSRSFFLRLSSRI